MSARGKAARLTASGNHDFPVTAMRFCRKAFLGGAMISTFNLAKLQDLLKDLYTLTKIRVTVFDDTFRELVAYPEHIAPICQLIRTDPAAFSQCMLCDKHSCETAARRHTPYTYRCHAGLTESIVPLYMGNIVIGYLLFGHILSYDSREQAWEQIESSCSSYTLDTCLLKTLCYEQPLISQDYISSAAHILQAVASYLCMERMAYIRQKDLPVQVDEYINTHYTQQIDVPDICAYFQIGKTYLYEIARQNYGMGIAEHIRRLRIEHAKKLLTDEEDMTIADIAGNCGFTDYNYFITVFKRLTGIPPRRYRLTNCQKQDSR